MFSFYHILANVFHVKHSGMENETENIVDELSLHSFYYVDMAYVERHPDYGTVFKNSSNQTIVKRHNVFVIINVTSVALDEAKHFKYLADYRLDMLVKCG